MSAGQVAHRSRDLKPEGVEGAQLDAGRRQSLRFSGDHESRSVHEQGAAQGRKVGYDPGALSRFLALSIVLLVLVMALFQFGLEELGWLPAGAPASPPSRVQLGAWGLEALGLAALFLLIHREESSVWFSGVLAGWIAWVFRGPLLVVSVAAAGLDPKPFWAMTFRWWLLYTVCGFVLAALARPDTRPIRPAQPDTRTEPAQAVPQDSEGPAA